MRLVGLFVSLIALAACGAPKVTGPAWPAASTTADDGGESLEASVPTVVTSIEKSADADPTPKLAAEGKSEPTAAVTDDKPVTVTPPQTPITDDVLMTDDMIIEIEDD